MKGAALATRPLTEQQRQMLAFIDPTADAYYLTVQTFVLRGEVNTSDLRRAVLRFVEASPSARSVVDADAEVERLDLVATIWEEDGGATDRTIDETVRRGIERVSRPMNVTAELPLRCWCGGTGEAVVLAVATHHLVFDAWSIGLMLEQVGREYATPGSLITSPPLERSPAPEDLLEGWDDILSRSYPQVRELAARERAARTGPAGNLRLDWPELTTQAVRKASRSWRATPFAMGAAAALGALQDLLDCEDVIFGSAAAGRSTAAELEDVAYYSTTIFLASGGASTTEQLVHNTNDQTRRWQRRPRTQWEPLLERYEALDLYPIKFGFQDLAASRPALQLPGVDVERYSPSGGSHQARRSVDTLVGYGPTGTTGVIQYRLDIFTNQQIAQFAEALHDRLAQIITRTSEGTLP
jgi:hypothetical protein